MPQLRSKGGKESWRFSKNSSEGWLAEGKGRGLLASWQKYHWELTLPRGSPFPGRRKVCFPRVVCTDDDRTELLFWKEGNSVNGPHTINGGGGSNQPLLLFRSQKAVSQAYPYQAREWRIPPQESDLSKEKAYRFWHWGFPLTYHLPLKPNGQQGSPTHIQLFRTLVLNFKRPKIIRLYVESLSTWDWNQNKEESGMRQDKGSRKKTSRQWRADTESYETRAVFYIKKNTQRTWKASWKLEIG